MTHPIIGLDASNLLRGGGRTHLLQILSCADPHKHKFSKIIVWGSSNTLKLIDDKPHLVKVNPSLLNKSFLFRLFWQFWLLGSSARKYSCDIIFVPGGNYLSWFRPYVTMCRNMLPFRLGELKRYGISLTTLRLLLLRYTQINSFAKATGLIFLTDHAMNTLSSLSPLPTLCSVIPHGVSRSFFQDDSKGHSQLTPNTSQINLIYTSIIDVYKHQWSVLEGVYLARIATGLDIRINFYGPSYPPALSKFYLSQDKFDPSRLWSNYHGAVNYLDLPNLYRDSDIGIFASTCENMPNILLEMMACGLPVLCSRVPPMPSILGPSALYFDPEDPYSISQSLCKLIHRIISVGSSSFTSNNINRAKAFDWDRTSDLTFAFLNSAIDSHRLSSCAT